MAKKKSLSKIQIELNNAAKDEQMKATVKDKTAAKRAKKAEAKKEAEAVSEYKYCDDGE